jgi:hypothetical protein
MSNMQLGIESVNYEGMQPNSGGSLREAEKQGRKKYKKKLF